MIDALGDHMHVHMGQLQILLLAEAASLVSSLKQYKCPMAGGRVHLLSEVS